MNSPALTSTTSPLRSDAAGTVSVLPAGVDAIGDRFGPRLAQRVGLRLAAAFGHRFGEVGEQHRHPQPERDLQLEADASALPCATSRTSSTVVSSRADLDDEHDRVLDHHARIELADARRSAPARTSAGSQMLSFCVFATDSPD